ncbi:hypothetical protein Sj15T_00740 [Sphingobium sp. TA15]|uniref:Uncharacterized protein n=1 Tax=Sphingobium indicum (strain DSM 16413 / CCM 7287 / MTCC 6362 / UT26 / NBRC 101211 / UT26S) TaxID=452662 RepID=D4YZE4_SPHIU|nr:hypothetical protein [Sphingobium indicum]BAI95726.1 hypothetical protein SJA_C1-08920 [Sphingobium indicum UT26S]BDD65053.1 hypothetical protein Sj15T_00740 [Sphingobium sp. TA15]
MVNTLPDAQGSGPVRNDVYTLTKQVGFNVEDDIKQACKDEQARVLERAIALPLPDAVFTIFHYNERERRSHFDPIPFTVLYVDHDPEAVADWQRRVSKLWSGAYDVGDAWHRHDGTYEKIRADYETANPGFNAHTYERAEYYGLFLSR